jgi:YVTN family beta-propeller protein
LRTTRIRLAWLAAGLLVASGGAAATVLAKRPEAHRTARVAAAQVLLRRLAAVRPTHAHRRARSHRAWDVVYAAAATRRLSPAVRGIRPRVYVPNSESGTVDVIDPGSGRVVARYAVGALPHHVTPAWSLEWLYVDNTDGNSLTVISPRTGRPVRTIPVEDPYNLYFTPDGKQAVVVAERLRRLDFRDPHDWKLIASVAIPGAGPDHLDFSADGRTLLLSTEWDGQLFRVDVDRHEITGHAHVGGLPVDVKLSPDGSVYYVANQGLGGVSILAADDLRQVGFVRTGAGAHGLCVSRNARYLYVSNRLAGSISVISFRTHRVVHTWHVGGSPDMLQVSLDGKELWVTNRFNASVLEIRIANGRVIRTIPVGAGPHGLAFFPQPGRYSIGHNGVYR